MPGLTAERIREKDLDARRRECLDEARDHLRVGSWRGLDGCEVTVVVRSVWELHGTACTCCPRRTRSQEPGHVDAEAVAS